MNKDCVFLDSEKRLSIWNILSRQILSKAPEISSGSYNSNDIILGIYNKLSSAGIDEAEKGLFIDAAIEFLPVIHGNLARNHKELYRSMIPLAEGFLDLEERFLDSDNLIDFIEGLGQEFAHPVEQNYNPDAPSQSAPTPLEEIEAESPEPDLKTEPEAEEEIAEQQLLASEQDSRQIAEVKTYIAKNEQGNNAKWIKALLNEGPVSIFFQNRQYDFRLDEKDRNLVHETVDGRVYFSMPFNDFIDRFNGGSIIKNRFENLDPYRNSAEEEVTYQHEQRDLFAEMGNGLSRVFTNAVHASQRAMDLFTTENGKFTVGPLAEMWKQRNILLGKYYRGVQRAGEYALNKQTLNGASLKVEVSPDDSLTYTLNGQTYNQLLLVHEKDGKKTVIGNFYPPSGSDKPVAGEAASHQKYSLLFTALYDKVKSSKEPFDITEQGVLFKKLFQPSQKRYAKNRIFRRDKDRYSNGSTDSDNAEVLNMKDFRQLLGAMGYGVSRVHINTLSGKQDINSSRALVAVSPFRSDEEINDILQNRIEWNEAEFSMNKIAKEHGISFIYLNRKELGLKDYIRLTAGNKSTIYRREGELDYNKKEAIFNLGQSPYLHYKVGVLLPIMRANIEKLEGEARDTAKQTLNMVVAYLFNDRHRFSDKEEDRKKNDRINALLKPAFDGKGKDRQVMKKFYDQVNENFEAWLAIKDTQERMELSKEYARRLFGYISKGSRDPRDKAFYEQKASLKKYKTGKAHPDTDGGMFMNALIDFFEIASMLQDKGVDLDSEWQKTGAEGRADGLMSAYNTTFNPPIDHAARKPYREKGINLAPAGKLMAGLANSEGDADISEEYYEVEYMPLAPHAAIDLAKLNRDLGLTSEAGSDSKPDFGNADDYTGLFKTVDSTEGFDFNLSEPEAVKLYDYLLGDIQGELRLRNSPIKAGQQFAIGQVYKGMIQLYSKEGKVSDRVLRHEIFHRLMNEILSPQERAAVLDAGAKMFPDAANVEEAIANFYDEHFDQFQVRYTGRLPKVLQDFYFFLRKLYLKLQGLYNEADFVLEKLESGYFRHSTHQYNHYDGSVKNKEFSMSFQELSRAFGRDADEDIRLREGEQRLKAMLSTFQSQILSYLYGNPARINEPLKSLPQAVNEYRQVTKDTLYKYPLFLNKKWDDIEAMVDNWTEQDLQDREKLIGFMHFQKEKYFHELKEHAFDFFDFKNTRDEDFEIALDEDAAEQQDDESTADALKRYGDRSLLSAVSALNKKVKFHLFSTLVTHNGKRAPVDAYKVTRLLKNLSIQVTQDSRNVRGQFSTGDFLNDFKKYLSSLESVQDSLEYATAKAIWDRFFNPENSGSYMRMAMLNTDPDSSAEQHRQRHQNALNAILSSFKSIVVQEFVKPTVSTFASVKVKTTDTSSVKSIKNNYNETIIRQQFFKKEENGRQVYSLNQEIIDTFFSGNSDFELAAKGNGLSFLINGTRVELEASDIVTGSGKKHDIKPAALKRVAAALQPKDIHRFFRQAGIPVTSKGIDFYILDNSKGRQQLANAVLQSYALMARQAMEEKRFALPEDAAASLKKLTEGKKDEPEQVLREGMQDSKATASNLSSLQEIADAEGQQVYSPTHFFPVWKAIAAADAFFGQESASSHEYILNTKHNKDKFPTALRRRLDWLNGLQVRLSNAAAEAEKDLRAYIEETFPWYSGNKLMQNELKAGKSFYFNHAENLSTGRGVELLDMSEKEFQRMLLAMVGADSTLDNESKTYLHPVDIQADRGYLPVVELNKFYEGEKAHEKEVGDIHTYHLHAAINVLEEIEQITGLPTSIGTVEEFYMGLVGDSMAGQDVDAQTQILAAFKKADRLLKKNPELLSRLQENKHYQMVGKGADKVPVIHQYLLAQLETSREDFIKRTEDSFLRYAAYVQKLGLGYAGNFNNKALNESTKYKEINIDFSDQYGKVSLIKKDANLKPQTDAERKAALNAIHPHLRNTYYTYYINNFHLSQMLSGNFFFFKGDGPTHMDAGYMTDYSKRQTGNGTSMVEPVFREVLPDGTIYSDNGLDYEVEFMNVEDFQYDWSHAEAKEFVNDFYAGQLPERTDSIKVHDGIQFYMPLFVRLFQNSMGNSDGFPIGNVIKAIGFNHDLQRGSVDYFKGLGMELNGNLLDQGEPVLHHLHKVSYQKGVVRIEGQEVSLWDIYEQTMAAQGRNAAEEAVYQAYVKARREGNVVRQPNMFINTKSSSKGAVRSINPLNIEGEYGEVNSDRASLEGFGAVMDLQKNIDKTDTDVALSMQMMYLLGINGTNYQRAFKLYKELGALAGLDTKAIRKEIRSISGEGSEADGFRNWALKQIRQGFERVSDFGLQYKLSSGEAAALSNPMLFGQFFAKVGNKMSKAIQQRGFGYKALQLPAYNLLKVYELNGKRYMKKDLGLLQEMGESMDTLQGRNLKFAHTAEGGINPAEVIAGNHLKSRFLLGDASLRETFSVRMGQGAVDLEADNYESLQEHQQTVEQFFNENFDAIDWDNQPVMKGFVIAAQRSKGKNKEKMGAYIKAYNGEVLTAEEKAFVVAGLSQRFADINRSLYGVFSRIPGTGKNSSSSFRIVGFENSYKNAVFVPAEWMHISGSDFDGDTLQVWLPDIRGNEEAQLNNKLLDFAREVLTDVTNKEEIFSPIELDYIEKDIAGRQRAKELAEGNEMRANDLYSQGKILQNNSAGTTMTGLNALLGKVFSYAIQTKQHLLDDAAAFEDAELAGKIGRKLMSVQPLPGEGNVLEQSPGILPEKDSKGQYVYKWIETLINSAVDNAKILGLGYIKLDKFTSNVQAAMTLMGYSKQTIVNFLTHPNIVQVVDAAKNSDDLTRSSSGNIEKTLNFQPFQMTTERANAVLAGSEPNMDNAEWAQAMLLTLVNYGKEYERLNNALKVTYPVKGVPDQQQTQIEQILQGLGFKSAAALRTFIDRVEKAEEKGKSLLSIDKIRKSIESSSLISPVYMVLKLPHLREYLKKHLYFEEVKENHLMYQEHVRRFQGALKRMINYRDIRRGTGKRALQEAVENFLAAKFFEQGNGGKEITTKVGDISYNLASVAERQAYIRAFAEHVKGLKLSGIDNSFVQSLDVLGSDIRYRYSQSMQKEDRVVPSNEFSRLRRDFPDLPKQFFYYQLATKGIRFHKDSMLHFFTADVFADYNRFLQRFEQDSSKLMDQQEGNILIENFLLTHPQYLKPIHERMLMEGALKTSKKDKTFVLANGQDDIKDRYPVAQGKVLDRYFKEQLSQEDGQKMKDLQQQLAELRAMESTDEIEGHIEDVIEQMRSLDEGEGSSRSLPLYAGITYFDGDSRFTYRFVYKYTEVDGKPYYVRVFNPYDSEQLAFSTKKALPAEESREQVLKLDPKESITEKAATLKDGKYITNQGYSVEVEGGKVKKRTEYSISRRGKVLGEDMARALAAKVQESFPNVQIRMVRVKTGVKGKAGGWVENGTVYLNLEKVTADTPLHELGHVLLAAIKQSNPGLYGRILDMVSEAGGANLLDPYYDMLYADDNDALLEEAFVTMLGLHQEGTLLASLNEWGRSPDSNLVASLIRKFWSDIKAWLNRKFGKELKLDEHSSLEELFEQIGTAVVQGQVLYRGKPQQTAVKLSKRDIERIKKQLIETGQLIKRCN